MKKIIKTKKSLSKCILMTQMALLVGGVMLGSAQAKVVNPELAYTTKYYQKAPVSLRSLSVNCPLSLKHNKSGRCFAKLFYSNGLIKKASDKVVWKSDSKYINISKTGIIKTTAVLAVNQLVKVTAQYTHNTKIISENTVVTLLKNE